MKTFLKTLLFTIFSLTLCPFCGNLIYTNHNTMKLANFQYQNWSFLHLFKPTPWISCQILSYETQKYEFIWRIYEYSSLPRKFPPSDICAFINDCTIHTILPEESEGSVVQRLREALWSKATQVQPSSVTGIIKHLNTLTSCWCCMC